MNIFKKNKVHVRVHKAFFNDMMDLNKAEHYFINVLNTNLKLDVIITKVWFEGPGNYISVIPSGRELPVMITPDEQWETWIRVDSINKDAYKNFYVQYRIGKLTNKNHTVRSTRRKVVPPHGTVPGDNMQMAENKYGYPK